jgi:hypothetical protein
MDSLIAAAVVTLFVNTADDVVSTSDGVLSLREAVTRANASTVPHVITFKGKGLGYQFMKSALEVRTQAPLTINGDVDNNGLADVALANGYAEKLIIRQGANVTIIGVDFYNGSGAGDAGKNGAKGVDGKQGLAGVPGKYTGPTTPPSKPTNGGPGGNGTPGKNGVRGENAAGIIDNFGKLTLVRLGLSSGYAIAGLGGDGGSGGWGRSGGRGGDGVGSGDEFWADKIFYPQDGATGGDSGDGARGGNGGDGGNAAGAILNEPTGTLTLKDVTFGGRLGGWLVDKGSTAIAARGGRFGPGGDGFEGAPGGNGGDQGYVRTTVVTFPWKAPSGSTVYGQWLRWTTTSVGDGGEGGDGGNRGADGRFGKPGDAASAVLNLGQMSGIAAIGDDGAVTRAPAQANKPPRYTNGAAGLGGFIGTLRVKTFSYCYDIALINNPDFTKVAMSYAPPDYLLSLPANQGRLPSPGRSPSTAIAGLDAARAPSVAAGKGVLGFLNAGSGKGLVKTAASLVFVHPLGVRTTPTGKTLDFNIVRLGKGNEPVVVKWAIRAAASGPSVSPPDFGTAALPAGSVAFPRLPAGALSDVDNSVKRVSIRIKHDNLTEPPEGYRVELISASRPSVLLGTKLVQGKLID